MKVVLAMTFAKGFTSLFFVGAALLIGGVVVYYIGNKKGWFK